MTHDLLNDYDLRIEPTHPIYRATKDDEPWLHISGALKTLNTTIASMITSLVIVDPTVTVVPALLDAANHSQHMDLQEYVDRLTSHIDSQIQDLQQSSMPQQRKDDLEHQFGLVGKFVTATTNPSDCTG